MFQGKYEGFRKFIFILGVVSFFSEKKKKKRKVMAARTLIFDTVSTGGFKAGPAPLPHPPRFVIKITKKYSRPTENQFLLLIIDLLICQV